MKRARLVAGLISFLSVCFLNTGAGGYQVTESYSSLRHLVLSTTPDKVGIKLKKPSEVWGVLIETGYPEGVVTLVAIADGTISLYLSGGSGILGVGEHPEPQRVARSLLAECQKFVNQVRRTNGYPLPKPSFTRFYLLTGDGALTVDAKEDDLAYGRDPFSPLYHKGGELKKRDFESQ